MGILTQREKRAFLRATKGVEGIMRQHDTVAYYFNKAERSSGGGLNCDNVVPNGIYSKRCLFDWDKVEKANRESIRHDARKKSSRN